MQLVPLVHALLCFIKHSSGQLVPLVPEFQGGILAPALIPAIAQLSHIAAAAAAAGAAAFGALEVA